MGRTGGPEDLYRRLCSGDPTAPAEFVEYWLDPLFRRLRRAYPHVDEDLVVDAVTDAILALIRHPSSYDPRRGSLGSYLWMSARGDLNNALERQNRQRGREGPTDPVELLAHERNFRMQESIEEPAVETAGGQLLATVVDPVDRQVLALMLHGERRTEAYAEVLRITDLPPAEQRRIVKRHKDRIRKRLRRLLRQHGERGDQ